MKLSTRVLSVLSSAALMTSLVAGCSAGDTKPTPIPRPDYIPEDIIMQTAGIAKDTPLIKLDGVDVPAEQVLYWASYTADSFAQYTGGTIDWSMEMGEGTTMQDYVLESALDTVKLYQVVRNHAEELKCGFNQENQAAYDADLAKMKSDLATEVGSDNPDLTYIQWLATVGLSEEGFASINQVSYLYENIRNTMYGEKGKEPATPEALSAWVEESGKLRVKHILIKAVPSEDGTDDGMAAALEKANGIRQELKDAGDTEVKFDELMATHSEDVNVATGEQNCGPEGYSFGPNEMVPEFEEGTKALQMGQISDPVQSTYGYHIILRLDPLTVADQTALKDGYASAKADALVDEWMAAAQVETTETYDSLDLSAYYTKLTELRTTVEGYLFPVPVETAAPEASTTPETTSTPATTPDPEASAGLPEASPAPVG